MFRFTLLAAVMLLVGVARVWADTVSLDESLETPDGSWPVLASTPSVQTLTIRSDATWRTSRGTVAVTPEWTSSLSYDDSDAAGWVNAFKSPSGDNIWHTSNRSS